MTFCPPNLLAQMHCITLITDLEIGGGLLLLLVGRKVVRPKAAEEGRLDRCCTRRADARYKRRLSKVGDGGKLAVDPRELHLGVLERAPLLSSHTLSVCSCPTAPTQQQNIVYQQQHTLHKVRTLWLRVPCSCGSSGGRSGSGAGPVPELT